MSKIRGKTHVCRENGVKQRRVYHQGSGGEAVAGADRNQRVRPTSAIGVQEGCCCLRTEVFIATKKGRKFG